MGMYMKLIEAANKATERRIAVEAKLESIKEEWNEKCEKQREAFAAVTEAQSAVLGFYAVEYVKRGLPIPPLDELIWGPGNDINEKRALFGLNPLDSIPELGRFESEDGDVVGSPRIAMSGIKRIRKSKKAQVRETFAEGLSNDETEGPRKEKEQDEKSERIEKNVPEDRLDADTIDQEKTTPDSSDLNDLENVDVPSFATERSLFEGENETVPVTESKFGKEEENEPEKPENTNDPDIPDDGDDFFSIDFGNAENGSLEDGKKNPTDKDESEAPWF